MVHDTSTVEMATKLLLSFQASTQTRLPMTPSVLPLLLHRRRATTVSMLQQQLRVGLLARVTSAGAGGVPNDANQVNRSQSADEFYSRFLGRLPTASAEFETVQAQMARWFSSGLQPTLVTGTFDYIHSEFDLDREDERPVCMVQQCQRRQARQAPGMTAHQRSPLMYAETHNL